MSIFPNRRRIERRLAQFCSQACPLGGDHRAHVANGVQCHQLAKERRDEHPTD